MIHRQRSGSGHAEKHFAIAENLHITPEGLISNWKALRRSNNEW
jgi:hypothetical protein